MSGYEKVREEEYSKRMNSLKRVWLEDLLNKDKELFDLYVNKVFSTNPLDIQRPIVSQVVDLIRANSMDSVEAFTLVLKAFTKYVHETDKKLIEVEILRPNQIVTNCEKILECPYKKDKEE